MCFLSQQKARVCVPLAFDPRCLGSHLSFTSEVSAHIHALKIFVILSLFLDKLEQPVEDTLIFHSVAFL